MRIASLFISIIFFPAFIYAAELININTADVALLDTLPEIGPVIAERIISYRETNGPFARIEDIQNVSGIKSATFAKIELLITVGDTSTPDTSDSIASSTSSSTASTTDTTATLSSSSGPPPEYIPIPTLRIITGGARTVSTGADTAFTAVVYDGKGNKRDGAFISWSFGDGMQRTGASVYHSYFYSGEYSVVLQVSTSDGGTARVESIITVKDANIKITSVSARGIALTNNSSRTLDLSLWRLSAGGKEFKIPAGTQILTGRTTFFPSQVIQLSTVDSASILYPSGEVAGTYPEIPTAASAAFTPPASSVSKQPSVSQTSINRVQAVEPMIISAATNIQTYEKAVIAPTAATELAAVGAVSTAEPSEGSLPALVDSPKTGGLFHSPWFIGLIGVITLAGSAFIFL